MACGYYLMKNENVEGHQVSIMINAADHRVADFISSGYTTWHFGWRWDCEKLLNEEFYQVYGIKRTLSPVLEKKSYHTPLEYGILIVYVVYVIWSLTIKK